MAGGDTPDPVIAPGGTNPDAWYRREWNRLAAAVLDPAQSGDRPTPDASRSREAAHRIGVLRAHAALGEALARGEPIEGALCTSVDMLAAVGEWSAAWAVTAAVGRIPGGRDASELGRVVLLHRRHRPAAAWRLAAALDDVTLSRFTPIEAVDAALADGTLEARSRAIAVGAPAPWVRAAALVDLAGRFLAFGERQAAAALVAEARQRPSGELDPRRLHALDLLEGWLEPRPASVPAGAVPVGIMGYRMPDHAHESANLGDHIQTLSMLGTLVRLSDVTFTGEDGLGELAIELQRRVRPEVRLAGVQGLAHLVPVNRDCSSADAIPEGTWMVAYGWHMLSLYDLRLDFPYHANIRPIFLSFHLNRIDLLTDDGVAYLRQHGPIGCRDWSTVDLLLAAGVDAFFTGCLTTTAGDLFPPAETARVARGSVGLVDVAPGPAERDIRNLRRYRQGSDDWRSLSVAEGARAALGALDGYRAGLDRAITSRLHAYLPLISLGIPVELRTRTPGDPRFAGLMGLGPGDPRLAELQTDIRDLVARVFARILAGGSPAEVYGLWRDLTRDRVADARTRFAAPLSVIPPTADVGASVAAILAGQRRFGPPEVDREAVADVSLTLDREGVGTAAVLLESIVANAQGPIRLWVLDRGIGETSRRWLAAAFPALPMAFLPCAPTHDLAGAASRAGGPIRPVDAPLLLLPLLLAEVGRVVHLDSASLVLDDICDLARADLGGRALAARDAETSAAAEWRRATAHLPEAAATDLRRWMGHRDGFGTAAIDGRVLLLDLDRLRGQNFSASCLGWVEAYGLTQGAAIQAHAGTDRCRLDDRWAAASMDDPPDAHGFIHGTEDASREPRLAFGHESWLAYATRLEERAGPPPTGEDGPDARGGAAASLTRPGVRWTWASDALPSLAEGTEAPS